MRSSWWWDLTPILMSELFRRGLSSFMAGVGKSLQGWYFQKKISLKWNFWYPYYVQETAGLTLFLTRNKKHSWNPCNYYHFSLQSCENSGVWVKNQINWFKLSSPFLPFLRRYSIFWKVYLFENVRRMDLRCPFGNMENLPYTYATIFYDPVLQMDILTIFDASRSSLQNHNFQVQIKLQWYILVRSIQTFEYMHRHN